MKRNLIAWGCVLAMALGAPGGAIAQIYDRQAMQVAMRLCELRNLPGDRIDCGHAIVDRWAALDTETRNAVVRKQADGFLQKCAKYSGYAFEDCAERAAAALGDAYVNPAIMVAKWDKDTSDLQSGQRELERARAACARAGLPTDTPALGMTMAQAAACGWGEPEVKRKLTTAGGVRVVWVYGLHRSITFLNGKVVAIEE